MSIKSIKVRILLSQEFPEKTRPVSFKHPVFQCPDMSPSPSVPSSGPSVSTPSASDPLCQFDFDLISLLPPVELVKAADIKVIAALGDSLTVIAGSFLPR